MKRVILLAVSAICLSAAGIIQADTVSVTSLTSFSDPSGAIDSSDTYAFVGTNTITFEVAGRTCNLNGSARGSVPMGCNYKIVVAADGSITGTLSAGNSVCTQTSDIAKSCN
jgi:hypothetical protein